MENQTQTTQTEETKTEEVNNTNNNTDTESNNETLTIEMVQKMIQSETDKVRTEYSKKLKAKEKEVEDVKKSSMTEQERIAYEKQQLEQTLAEREKALAEKERAFELAQLEIEAVKILDANEIPIEFKQFLLSDTLENTNANINLFKKTFDEAVAKVISERIKGTSKEQKVSFGNGNLTIEEWTALPYKERIKIPRP